MSVIESQQERDQQSWLNEIRNLREFSGTPAEFWPRMLEGLGNYSAAVMVLLLVEDADKQRWRRMSAWPQAKMNLRNESDDIVKATALAQRTFDEPIVIEHDAHQVGRVAIELNLGEGQPGGALVFFIKDRTLDELSRLSERLQLLADIPAFYQFARVLRQAKSDVVQFADAIDLMSLLNECDRFMSAAMTLCNELAARHECDRVSLGWLDGAYVRVQAISHMEKFEKKMSAVQTLEAAMEESFDQDEEIIWPPSAEMTSVTRDHERYASEQSLTNVLSLPVRLESEGLGVVTLEREGRAFDDEEVRGIRLLLDQATRHLAQLRRYDRWIGARFATWSKEMLAGVLGPEHTFAKAIGVILSVVMLFVLFGSLEYRVEGTFILRTDAVAFVPSPFEGYISEVKVEIGDRVEQGAELLSLDTRELRLEEAMALADIVRYSREMDKARAQGALADMRIAQALVAQSEAELDKVRYHIDTASIRAAFDGIVVEGDLKQMLGAPVRKGDILFKLADISEMFVEIDLPERDVHEIATGRPGEIAFVSRPESRFGIDVTEIDPAAVTKEQGNMFLIRAHLQETPLSWWRPGMSGVAKISVGDRNVLWILTHRTVDFFRMLLWW